MKSMNNDDENNDNISNNNWLGFSLSPNMEVPSSDPHHHHHHHHHHQSSSTSSTLSPSIPSTSFFHSSPVPPQLNYGLYYGVEGENGGFYSPLSVMPLKSDGSLCIMEALSRSQSQAMVTSSTPKLEDFFGSATMGTHHYESNDREVMALSLDSMLYNHDPNNNQTLLNQDHHHHHHSHHPQQQHYSYSNNNYSESHIANCNLQLPAMANDHGVHHHDLKSSWVSTHAMVENGDHNESGPNSNNNHNNICGNMGYGDLQSLSLSMSPVSQSSCVTAAGSHSSAVVTDCVVAIDTKKRGSEKGEQKQIVHRKSLDTFGQRTSQYRGVTRHRWTGRYEAHLWDNSCKKEGQSRKGRQVYLGGYDVEEKAARAYDLAALKYWGPSTHINFPLENYQEDLEEMKNMTREEYVAHLRRKSSGFSRGASMYRGVTRHHQHGRWQARIGRVAGNKDLYLGTFSTQEEAAEAYDIAAIKFRGPNAVTNFDITRYNVERIMASNTLLAGDLARRTKEAGSSGSEAANHNSVTNSSSDEITMSKNNESESDWKMALYHSSQQLDQKPFSIDTYKTELSSVAPLSMIHQEVEGSAKMGTHLSNASSLVTSLSSSRDGSPDKCSHPTIFGMPPTVSKVFTSPTNAVNSWIPPTQQRPAISMPHMPIFAAWTDS